MAHREIRDANGVVWEVWEVRPTVGVLPQEMREGWLAFQSHHERRRLSPIPPGWNKQSDATLLEYLARAESRSAPRRLIE